MVRLVLQQWQHGHIAGRLIQGFSLLQLQLLGLLQETPLYTEDWIGLQVLDQAGKLHFMEVDGNHLQLDQKSLDLIIDTYLK